MCDKGTFLCKSSHILCVSQYMFILLFYMQYAQANYSLHRQYFVTERKKDTQYENIQ